MSGLLYAIGDIHGRVDLLEEALRLIAAHASGSVATVVFLGDYIDRGPASRQVVERLMRGPDCDSFTWVCLKGNHERMMCDASAGTLEGLWLHNGGAETLLSYGGKVPQEHLAWMRELSCVHETEHQLFVHAGFEPGRPLDEHHEGIWLWIRHWNVGDCGREPDFGKHVVHGHTPHEFPQRFNNSTNLDSGAVWTNRLSIGVFDADKPGGPVEILTAEARLVA